VEREITCVGKKRADKKVLHVVSAQIAKWARLPSEVFQRDGSRDI
jgi:hypothetical protein